MLTWRAATEHALYGPDGFFRRPDTGPGRHFRTAAHASDHFARAMVRLLVDVDESLGHPPALDLVDVGAGRGELLAQVVGLAATGHVPASLVQRLHLMAVERAPRPVDLPDAIAWQPELPRGIVGLLVANEWLDNVPLDVVARVDDAWRVVLVDPDDGRESLGSPPDASSAQWLASWWPATSAQPGDRAEVGLTRDAAWASAVRCIRRGVAVAVDYAHNREERAAGRWSTGSLAAFRDGREVEPVPDGTCDLTTHVSLDSCAAAGLMGGATASHVTTQRAALLALGLDAGRPDLGLAAADPARYLRELVRAGEVAELIDRDGLGGFGWLIQARGVELPPTLSGTPLA